MDGNGFQRAYCEDFVAGTIVPRTSRHLTRQLDELLRVADLRPQDRVLEVGCGMGRFTLQLAERGVQVEGLDFSPVLLDRLRAFERGRFDIPLHVGDALSPPRELDGRFDAAVGFFVLHHLQDLDDAIKAIARVLKPRGRLVFLDANGYNPLFYLQILITPGMTWQGEKGMSRMRPKVVFQAMRRAGLHRPAVTRFGFLPSIVVDRTWGARLDAGLERFGLPDVLHAFQVFSAERPS